MRLGERVGETERQREREREIMTEEGYHYQSLILTTRIIVMSSIEML